MYLKEKDDENTSRLTVEIRVKLLGLMSVPSQVTGAHFP